jgi:hypothetical protein
MNYNRSQFGMSKIEVGNHIKLQDFMFWVVFFLRKLLYLEGSVCTEHLKLMHVSIQFLRFWQWEAESSVQYGKLVFGVLPRVEAGSNTSTVTLRVVWSDEKGSLESETVKYGHESYGIRTRKWLRWRGPTAIVNDRPVLSSERTPQIKKPANVWQ